MRKTHKKIEKHLKEDIAGYKKQRKHLKKEIVEDKDLIKVVKRGTKKKVSKKKPSSKRR